MFLIWIGLSTCDKISRHDLTLGIVLVSPAPAGDSDLAVGQRGDVPGGEAGGQHPRTPDHGLHQLQQGDVVMVTVAAVARVQHQAGDHEVEVPAGAEVVSSHRHLETDFRHHLRAAGGWRKQEWFYTRSQKSL